VRILLAPIGNSVLFMLNFTNYWERYDYSAYTEYTQNKSFSAIAR
jgi:hypothetical protein